MKNKAINTSNLICLWKTASTPFNGYFDNDNFGYACIENTQWPNKIWMNKTFSKHLLEEVKEKLGKYYTHLTLSIFSYENEEVDLRENIGLKLKSLQYGMSIKLTNKFDTQKELRFKQVTNQEEAEKWSSAFFSAFGYEINTEIISKTKDEIPFYLVYFQNELVGTVILFITDTVAGIHSLGILPEKRKQGFASEIMYHILNRSIDLKLSMATLQASEMAKDMYIKIGFSTDFIMENYQLK